MLNTYIMSLLLSVGIPIYNVESIYDVEVSIYDVEVSIPYCTDTYNSLLLVTQSVRRGNYTKQEEICQEPPPPDLYVQVEGVGDRFSPVDVRIDYIDSRGEPAEYTYSLTQGYAVKKDWGLQIFKSGEETGVGTLVINDTEEYQYTLIDEPTCQNLTTYYDCYGYMVSPFTGPLIDYGPEDTTVVFWEVLWVVYNKDLEYPEISTLEQRDRALAKIEAINNTFTESGVYVQLRPVGIYQWAYGNLNNLQSVSGQLDIEADLVYGSGRSYSGTCGVAQASPVIQGTAVAMGKCDTDTDVHEIGHTAGLAHGPSNQGNPRNGYIFPNFGHGWNNLCGSLDSFMSYGNYRYFFSNSLISCKDTSGTSGYREYSDEAYAINRIRYDYSLRNDESGAYLYIEQDKEENNLIVVD